MKKLIVLLTFLLSQVLTFGQAINYSGNDSSRTGTRGIFAAKRGFVSPVLDTADHSGPVGLIRTASNWKQYIFDGLHWRALAKEGIDSSAVLSLVTWSNLSGKPATFPAAAHSHSFTDIPGLADSLLGKAPLTALADTSEMLRDLIAGVSGSTDTSHLRRDIDSSVKRTELPGILAPLARSADLRYQHIQYNGGDAFQRSNLNFANNFRVLDNGINNRTDIVIDTIGQYHINGLEDSLSSKFSRRDSVSLFGGLATKSNLIDTAALIRGELNNKISSSAIGVTVQGYDANTTKLGNATTGTGDIVRKVGAVLTTPDIGNATGNITGNAGTSTQLQNGRTISITGDFSYTSPSFNGTSNVTAAGTLATVNSNVGSFGSASSVATFTTNSKGLNTAAGSVPIQIAESQVTNLVSDLAAKASTASVALKIDSVRRQAGSQQVQMKINGTWVNAFIDSAGSSGWSLTGNSSLSPGTNYLGNSDNNETWFKNNTSLRMVVGTAAPSTYPSLGNMGGASIYVAAGDNSAKHYGNIIGSNSTTGDGYLQAVRVDGTATAYNLAIQPLGGRVVIGTASPATSSILHAASTDKGVLFCPMTNSQISAIGSLTEGLQAYDLTSHGVRYYNGTTWHGLWGTRGNTIVSGDWFGSINNEALVFKVNNQERMYIGTNGQISAGGANAPGATGINLAYGATGGGLSLMQSSSSTQNSIAIGTDAVSTTVNGVAFGLAARSAHEGAMVLTTKLQGATFFSSDYAYQFKTLAAGYTFQTGSTPATQFEILTSGKIKLYTVPTYADNAAAISGGETTNTVYKTSTGQLMIVY